MCLRPKSVTKYKMCDEHSAFSKHSLNAQPPLFAVHSHKEKANSAFAISRVDF